MEWPDLVPADGLVTVCEINCRLVNAETNGALDGVKPSVVSGPTYPEISLSNGGHTKFLANYAPVITIEESQSEGGQPRVSADGPMLQRIYSTTTNLSPSATSRMVNSLPRSLSSLLKSWFPSLHAVEETVPDTNNAQPIAWHPRQQILAAADTADRVHVYNVDAAAPVLGSSQATPPPPLLPELVLYHEFQRQVGAIAWRPPCGGVLAVGCLRGICIWNLGGGPAGNSAAAHRSGSPASAWMTFLRTHSSAPITALSWSPCGRLLASASAGSAVVEIWNVALGVSSRIQSVIGQLSLLRWSPCGGYLLAGGLSNSFLVWETDKWHSQIWRSPDSGVLMEASWKPDGRAVALAFSKSTLIVMLHFISRAPQLNAQMLPLDLPELRMTSRPEEVEIHCMAWDPAGGRLAVILRGSHPAAGLLALYATSCDSLVTANFIGFARPLCVESGHLTRHHLHSDCGAGMRMSFQGGFKQGALLAVRHGEGHICMLPMYFAKR